MVMNKRGMDATGVLIALVIGVIIVVLAVWALNGQFNIFSSKSNAYAGISNLDAIATRCTQKCANGQTNIQDKIVLDSKTSFMADCQELQDGRFYYEKHTCASVGGVWVTNCGPSATSSDKNSMKGVPAGTEFLAPAFDGFLDSSSTSHTGEECCFSDSAVSAIKNYQDVILTAKGKMTGCTSSTTA